MLNKTKDMKVKPQRIMEYDLIYMNQNPNSGCLLYNKETELLTSFDLNLNQIGTIKLGFKREFPCSVHPEKSCFSVIKGKQWLGVYDFTGNKLKEISGTYECAAFSLEGNLWLIERLGHEQLKLKIYDGELELLTTLDIEDSLFDSHLFLTAVPKSNDMILELAAGQDGSSIILLTFENNLVEVKDMFPESCLSCPAFNEDGTKFLTLEFYDGILYHYSYPQLELLGEFEYDMESEVCGTIIYLNSESAIISYDYRYFLLDIDSMKIVEEIIVEGHEPVATEKIYPNLEGDESLITDISDMRVVGDKVLANLISKSESKMLVFDKTNFIQDYKS